MANTVTLQKIADNTKNAVVHVYLASDGAAGELSDSVVVDVSDLAGGPGAVRLLGIDAALTGFSAILEWDATTDVPFLALPGDQQITHNYCEFGGLQNNAGAGITGDITITTSGFTTAGDRGHITFRVAKS